ncbi:TPA: MarR family transcriptional regulator [Burkholderia multivorans]|nr:MarR family transcriptional regulator [Burkholderia multivorans]HEF4742378.1 MarR family transcriptional regulator [Burkholderia multivorans]
MKTRVHSEETHKAETLMKRLVADGQRPAVSAFPPDTYRYELSQVQILSTLLGRIYSKQMLPLHDLPLLEWRLLEAIGGAPGITAAEFAQYWVYDKVAVSRALRTLKTRGFVESAPHPTDGRRIELRLTAAGQAAYESQLGAKHRQLEALSSVLTDQEMSEFAALARKLIDHFRRVDEML